MTTKDPRTIQTEAVREYTERLASLHSSPPVGWDASRRLFFVRQVALLVSKCPRADEEVITAFVDKWAKMIVEYKREDEQNRRRGVAQSA